MPPSVPLNHDTYCMSLDMYLLYLTVRYTVGMMKMHYHIMKQSNKKNQKPETSGKWWEELGVSILRGHLQDTVAPPVRLTLGSHKKYPQHLFVGISCVLGAKRTLRCFVNWLTLFKKSTGDPTNNHMHVFELICTTTVTAQWRCYLSWDAEMKTI